MPNYDPPNMRNIPFRFTAGGYQKPDFGAVPLRWALRPSYQQTADLQGAITVMNLQTSTYTYLKECKTIVVGYGPTGPQILKLPCVYGGIRDLGASLVRVPPNVDLPAYLFAVPNFKDLLGYTWTSYPGQINLSSFIWVYQVGDPKDLAGHLWPYFIGYKDLPALFHGWDTKDLLTYVYGIPPVNLQALLNVIAIGNLSASITGEWWHGSYDLSSTVPKIFLRESSDLSISIYGTELIGTFLQASITPMHPRDLVAYLVAGVFKSPRDLGAFLSANPVENLTGIIHGWAEKYLVASVAGVYGPYDLQAYLYANPSVNLSASVSVFKGIKIPFDLRATVEAYFVGDLPASIGLIHPMNLAAYITAIGKTANLGASIVPKTILIRRAIQVALLEHKDLKALINFMCVLSDSSNLGAYVYPLMKYDLRAVIIGWYGSSSDNLLDLSAYINVRGYIVQDALRSLAFAGLSERLHYGRMNVKFSTTDTYLTVDTLPVFFGTMNRLNLSAYIDGILTSKDLSATLTPVFDWNYTDLPPWIIPRTREVVLNIERMEEQWRRFVEIMFDNAGESDEGDVPFTYFYVNGSQRVYRLDRDRHWTVWVKSFVIDDDSMIEHKLVRYKYKFNMSNYSTIDEAIRDLIDRVSTYRNYDLTASIFGELPYSKDLQASLDVHNIYSWLKRLRATITGVVNNDYSDINGVITGIP